MENKGIPLISINNSLKEHDKKVVLGANANTKMGHIKGPWNHYIYTSSNSGASASAYASEDGGYTNLTGFSWPPRLYVCSFCKREFRSAQALGGHMNVHRRDRARLRQSPPKELLAGIGPPPVNTVADYSLNFIPNPNPNLIQSSPLMIQKSNTKTATYITDYSKIPSSLKSSSTCIISSPSRTHDSSGMMRWLAAKPNPWTTSAATRTPNLYDANNNEQYLNNFQHVNINKKAWEKGGLLRLGFRTSKLRKEDAVDLELRLGYSSEETIGLIR